ncbi:MAG: hypothetical protein AAF934_03095 [Bacteroidota bacterium]
MKKASVLSITISALLFGCTPEHSEECDPEIITFKWMQGKEINVAYDPVLELTTYTVENGDNLVFEYNYTGAQCDNIADDEWGELLTFEIDKDATEFEFTDDAILETKCFYQHYGAWIASRQYEIKDGTILGNKIDNTTWQVTADVTVIAMPFGEESPRKIAFQKTFRIDE